MTRRARPSFKGLYCVEIAWSRGPDFSHGGLHETIPLFWFVFITYIFRGWPSTDPPASWSRALGLQVFTATSRSLLLIFIAQTRACITAIIHSKRLVLETDISACFSYTDGSWSFKRLNNLFKSTQREAWGRSREVYPQRGLRSTEQNREPHP